MFDFSRVNAQNKMSRQDVLNNQQMIFEHYLGQSIELKKRYRNPLRNDTEAGCFFKWKGDKILFYDYAGQKTYDVFSFVSDDYVTAMNSIQKDFDLGVIHNRTINQPTLKKEEEPHVIQFVPREFNKLDLKWWGAYMIDKSELKKENIFSVEKLYIDSYKVPSPELCFAYYYEEIDKVKIYKPLEKKNFKWHSNVPFSYIDTLKELPIASKTVLITKAKKCKIVLKKIFNDTCATQGESYHAIPKTADDFFNEHYERKVCFFDADPTGKEANKKLNERGYGWVNIPNYLYDCCGIKDPSDYTKEFKELKLLERLLKDKNIYD